MSFPLVREESKQRMNELVETLNSTIEFDSSIDFTAELNDEYGYYDEWDWNFNKCCVCKKIWYMERATCNGTTSEAVKLHNGLRCPHCHRGYCSFDHMKPKILIPNEDKINDLTGIRSCVIYKMCAHYLKHMTMSNEDDSFVTGDSGYGTMFINGNVSESVDGIKLKCLRYVLMNQNVNYSDKKHYLKEDVIEFVSKHFNDCEEYIKQIVYYNEYSSTDAIMIISTFVGCQHCLNQDN